MENNYEIRGDVVVIFLTSKHFGKLETKVSLSELPRLQEFNGKWSLTGRFIKGDVAHIYVRSRPRKSTGIDKEIYLHRWLTNCPKGMNVDHINNVSLDNTNSNLRIVTASENSQNRKGPNITNTTGIRGVCWSKNNKKWKVIVTVNKISNFIGYFNDITDAENAAKNARSKIMTHSIN